MSFGINRPDNFLGYLQVKDGYWSEHRSRTRNVGVLMQNLEFISFVILHKLPPSFSEVASDCKCPSFWVHGMRCCGPDSQNGWEPTTRVEINQNSGAQARWKSSALKLDSQNLRHLKFGGHFLRCWPHPLLISFLICRAGRKILSYWWGYSEN